MQRRLQMNKDKIILVCISLFTVVRSIYQFCVYTMNIMCNPSLLSRIIILGFIIFIFFENYVVFSCLLKEKSFLSVEIEFSIITFVYLFSIGYSICSVKNLSISGIIIAVLYVIMLEFFKVKYLKKKIL